MRILERLRHRSPDGEAATARLSRLTQVELAAVEAHERSHRERPVVLNRLRWLRGTEPLPGYDALESDEIGRALADADQATLKRVRSYERRHRDRRDVRAEIARLLPTAQRSAAQDRARDQKSALVQAGIRSGPSATQADPFDGRPSVETVSHEQERLRDEARYRRERLQLYRARLYGGAAADQDKLRELQRASDGAAARLRRAEATTTPSAAPPR
ncbi:MAG TPA: hypothetical protein VHJ37_10755 [Thermoleophilaceae bacterium]|jgi:hypothetical protein|nr:hypothetical protein [Thermoleophilaceae bacterium]